MKSDSAEPGPVPLTPLSFLTAIDPDRVATRGADIIALIHRARGGDIRAAFKVQEAVDPRVRGSR